MTDETRVRSQLVIVTGVSGAGRSTTLAALADLGYYCVDNLPPSAFDPTLEACEQGQLSRIAFGLDVRVQAFASDAMRAFSELRRRFDFTLLFLDASDAVLFARFSSTRRPHPLETLGDSASDRSLMLVDGIKLERERLAALRADASLLIDTSELNVHELRRRVVELFRPKHGGKRGMVTRFVTFGFKYGTPGDCDMMFDVRFIDNPYFVLELKEHSGLVSKVADFVRSKSEARTFCDQATAMLETLLPLYEQEGKSYLTVGFGCTGGRHRSVAMAEWVAARLRRAGTRVDVVHRDINRAEKESTSGAPPALPVEPKPTAT